MIKRKVFSSVLKATLPVIFVTSMLSSMFESIGVGFCSNRADQLGSAVAVGSPVLNQNFATDSWNPYELECFGVYLSNFVEPLAETYKEAFTSGGNGLYALTMSTGNDPYNNATLKGLLDVAIGKQLNQTTPLYMGVYDDNGNITVPGGGDDTKGIATLYMFYGYGSVMDVSATDGVTFFSGSTVETILEGADESGSPYLPKTQHIVFYKEVEGGKKVMFDTGNVHDCDALNALLAYEFNSGHGETFHGNFASQMASNLAVDSFGNIVLSGSGLMVYPACLNTHSTQDGVVNFVNRYMLNTFTVGGSSQLNIGWETSDVYAAYIRGPVYTDWRNGIGYAGYPTNASNTTSAGMFYAQTVDEFAASGTASLGVVAADSITTLGSNDSGGGRRQALYNLMRNDYIMGKDEAGLRFANPINLNLASGSGWNSADQGKGTNGYGEGEAYKVEGWAGATSGASAATGTAPSSAPSLYFLIQMNNLATESHIVESGSADGRTPAGQIFNEIYLPTEDGDTIPLFKSGDAWRVVCSQLWAAEGGNKMVNDEAFKEAECAQAYINALSHCVYDRSHTSEQATYKDTASGKFGSMALSFISNITDDSKNSFNDLCGISDTESATYTINKFGGGTDKLVLSHYSGVNMQNQSAFSGGDWMVPLQNYYKIYSLSDTSYVYGLGSMLNNGMAGQFDNAASYVYVTYLNYFGIGKQDDQYGVKTAVSDFDPAFFDTSILTDDFSSFGINAPDSAQQAAAARQRMMLLLDPDKGADYRRELVTSTLTKFCTDSYNKMAGTKLGVTSGSTLCLQDIADNPFTGWLVKHEAWIILLFTFVALVLASWTAITRGKGWFWAVCQIAIGILGITCIPFMLNAGIGIANLVSQKCYSANGDIWWLADAVENREAEIKLGDMYDENADDYKLMNISKNDLASIILGSSSYQSIRFAQDISNKHTMNLSGLYASLSQYPSAAWILPTLLEETTAGDEKAGYYVRVGAYRKLSELEVTYWGYVPTAIGDTHTMNSPNAAGLEVDGTLIDGGGTVEGNQTVDGDGNTWYWGSLGRTVPPAAPMHCSETITGQINWPKGLMENVGIWNSTLASEDKIHAIELAARSDSPDIQGDWEAFIGKGASQTQMHTISPMNNSGSWYLMGTESPLTYFYAVMQDTFYGFNTAQSIDALVGTTVAFPDEPDEYYNLNFLQATVNGTYNINGSGSGAHLASDHTWEATAQGTDYARDILDLDYFYRYYAPTMYHMSIYTGGSQIGLGEEDATEKDVVGAFGSETIEEAGYEYPIYKDNYASWLYASNWAVKLYENPQNIKPQVIRTASGEKETVCPINPYTYTKRPFVTCRAQMEALGINEGDLTTVELANVEANDEAMLEIVKTVNVYVNAPATLDVNSFKDLLAVKCLAAYANHINQAAIMNSKFKIIPNGFEYGSIAYDTVFSQMLYNNYRKANAYTVDMVVEGYIADEGPIMALLLLLVAALGSTVIPFVLRIGVAILYVVNIWAALNAVVESLETKASVILASLINTASFVARTCILFVIQAFMMSLGGAGIIVSKSSIGFTGGATLLIISLLVFYVLYTFSIVRFFGRTIANGNDMGAAYLQANYDMARTQGLAAFARHKANQSFLGKTLNKMSNGILANSNKASVTGHNAGGGDGDSTSTTTSATGSGNGGGAPASGGSSDGANTIENARNRSNTSLDQAAEKVHADGKDNPSGGSYIAESVDKGKSVDTRSDEFMAQAFGNKSSDGTGERSEPAPKGQPQPQPQPKASGGGGGGQPQPQPKAPSGGQPQPQPQPKASGGGGGQPQPKPEPAKPKPEPKPERQKPEPPKTKI